MPRGNQAVRKLAKPWDIWLHVESGPGAHVIIRRKHPGDIVPDATLEEAGFAGRQQKAGSRIRPMRP